MSATAAHTLLIVVALAAYVVLTALGHDGNPVFVFMGGQGAGAALQAATKKQ